VMGNKLRATPFLPPRNWKQRRRKKTPVFAIQRLSPGFSSASVLPFCPPRNPQVRRGGLTEYQLEQTALMETKKSHSVFVLPTIPHAYFCCTLPK